MDVLHIFLNPSLKNPNKTHKTKQQCLVRRSYYYYCINYDQHLWILMKLKYESYMYNEKKIARLTAEPDRTLPTLHGKGRRRLPLPRPSRKNHTSWLSSFLFVIYSHDVVPTFSLSSYFGSFEILLTWYLCVGFSRSQ